MRILGICFPVIDDDQCPPVIDLVDPKHPRDSDTAGRVSISDEVTQNLAQVARGSFIADFCILPRKKRGDALTLISWPKLLKGPHQRTLVFSAKQKKKSLRGNAITS